MSSIPNILTINEKPKMPVHIDVIPLTTLYNNNTTNTNTTILHNTVNALNIRNNLNLDDTKINNIDKNNSSPDTEINNIDKNNIDKNNIDKNNIDKINGDTSSNLFYDVLHVFYDVYSYGRTLIENNYINFSTIDDFNLVYPNIYIGNYSTTTNLQLLQDIGITHIISIIPKFNPPFPDLFTYLFFSAYDDQKQNIKQYFNTSNEFITKAVRNKGKVLIHCMAGRSRSVTLFLAFLIHIIHGNINQNDINIYSNTNDCNDVCNEIEYKKLCNNNSTSSNSPKNINNTTNNTTTNNTTNNTTNFTIEKITQINYQLPKLTNKYSDFIVYKKSTMIDEVNELINKYALIQKELSLFIDGNYTQEHKKKLTTILFKSLLNYITKYRPQANVNSNFITQLIDNI